MKEWIIAGIILNGLLTAAVMDIKWKRINSVILLICSFLVWIVHFIAKDNWGVFVMISLCIFLFFYLVSVLTHEQIGRGDAFLFLLAGSGLGVSENVVFLFLCFFFAFVGALCFLLIRHVNKSYEMPLAPYVLVSYLILFIGKQAGGGVI